MDEVDPSVPLVCLQTHEYEEADLRDGIAVARAGND